MSAMPVRFSPQAVTAVLDTLIVTGSGTGYHLDFRNASGTIVRQLSVPAPRRGVTQPMRDALIALELQRLAGPHSEAMVDPGESGRLAREAPFADSLPSYQSLFVSPDNTLWVVDSMALGDTAWNATAFTSNGAMAGRLHVSGHGWPLAFGRDRVLIREEDAEGVVSLKAKRLKGLKAKRPNGE